MSEELKACPYCGSDAELFETVKGFGVECGKYDCNIGTMQTDWTESKAVEIWNTRTLTQKQQCADEMYEFLASLQLDVANDYRRDEILAKARGESCGNWTKKARETDRYRHCGLLWR